MSTVTLPKALSPSPTAAMPLLTVLVLSLVLGLTVNSAAHAQPEFSKSFELGTIGPGSTVALRFDIDNGAGIPVTDLAFTDPLPAAIIIASPANASTDCAGATLTAPDGGGVITLTDGAVGASSTCTVTVDVTSSVPGTHTNTTGDLTSSAGNSGNATADLTVSPNIPGFSKAFSPSTIGLGGRSRLTFTIDNTAGTQNQFSLSFTDMLPTGVVLADPPLPATDCTGGVLNAAAGSSLFSYTPAFFGDATLSAGATCTVSVDVTGAAVGNFTNVSNFLTGTSQGSFTPFTSGRAIDVLTVTTSTLSLVKEFTDDPVQAGGTATLEFTLTNRDRFNSATGLTFTDDLDATLSGLVATGLPASNVCGAGSNLTGTSLLSLTGGNLAPGASCTFSVPLQVPAAAAAGAYPNATSTVTGTIDGSPSTGDSATDSLVVSDAPSVTKTFLADPVGAGSTVDLEFTITNVSSTSAATDIRFEDDLNAFLSGATASALPAAGFCGAGSIAFTNFINGNLNLFISGGNLPASGSCTFVVTLQIAAGTPPGTYTNSTNVPSATVGGSVQFGVPAEDTLTVAGAPDLVKSFTNDPVLPGDTVDLEFTLTHSVDASADATGITFTDDLSAVLSGLTAVGLPANDICGIGSSLTGTTNLTFSGGTLAPGASCTFSVTLQVPAAAVPGSFLNQTSSIMATVGGLSVSDSGAADTLVIAGLSVTKTYLENPVLPGALVPLEFTIENSSTVDATAIFFADNLAASLSGLAAEAPLPATPCGAGSTIMGTTFLIFTGGELTAGTSCTFTVNVRVPAGAADGDYVNFTSSLTATVGGGTIAVDPAIDTLSVVSDVLALTKEFTDDPVAPGATATLEFTLTNLGPDDVTGISFTDDLDAALSGLTATALPAAGFCGAGSTAVGAGNLAFSGMSLLQGTSCTFSVTVQVPAAVGGSVATNTTSGVTGTSGGVSVSGGPASDDLIIETVTFTKAFDGPTVAGGTPTLTLTIENQSVTTTLTGLSFTDDLDATLTGLVATGLPTADVCGAGSNLAGTSLLTLTGGTLLPGGSCTIVVSLQVPGGAAAGSFPNTTSALFSSGLSVAIPATATLTVAPPPTFAKIFAPDTIVAGAVSTLTFTIDNSASPVAASALDFIDNLPAGVTVAITPNVANTCGGSVGATAGATAIGLSSGSVGAGATCAVSVDVTGVVPGAQVNTTGDLTSSSGNSGTATDTLTVSPPPPPSFTKVFSPDAIGVGLTSTVILTIDNSAALVSATGLAVNDNLPAGMTVATPANASNTCGGTLTAVDGSGTVTLSGGSVGPGPSCTVSFDVTPTVTGDLVNTTGDLTSSSGNSGSATDTLTVVPQPTFAKAFAPNPTIIGGVSTLTFTIDNTGSSIDAVVLGFVDTLPAGLLVATPANASATCTDGTLTATAGTGTITYSGGTAAATSTCTVQVDVTPSVAGDLMNISGDLTSSLGNSGPATDTLRVNPPPTFAKAFAPTTITAGDTSTLTFTIDNTASTVAAAALDFTDSLPIPVTVAATPNASTTCNGGTITAVAGSGTVSYTGGSVAAGGTCTLQVDVTSATAGSQVNTSGDLTSSLGNSGPATATLEVELAIPTFAKAFLPDLIAVTGRSTLTFTIDNPINASPVGNLTFTDTFPANLVVASPPNVVNGCGGTVTANAGAGSVSLAAGTVAGLSTCTVSVEVTTAVDGVYDNVVELTSDAGSSGNATATLNAIARPMFAKAFLSAPVLRGGAVTLEYTITNPSNQALTDVAFNDDIGAVFPGLAAEGLPTTDVCGAGSQVAGTAIVSLTGGSLAPGASCTFGITVRVPTDAPLGSIQSVSGPVTAVVLGESISGNSALAELEVAFLEITKAFLDTTVVGGAVTGLEFTITNPDPVNTATAVTFTDDLDAALPGLAAIDLPQVGVCGAGSQADGTSVITLTGGVLGPTESCVFTVTVQVPGDASGTFTNVTSVVGADVDGQTAEGDASGVATSILIVEGNPIEIPTLGGWGFLLLAGVLGLLGLGRIRRR